MCVTGQRERSAVTRYARAWDSSISARMMWSTARSLGTRSIALLPFFEKFQHVRRGVLRLSEGKPAAAAQDHLLAPKHHLAAAFGERHVRAVCAQVPYNEVLLPALDHAMTAGGSGLVHHEGGCRLPADRDHVVGPAADQFAAAERQTQG